MKIVVVGYGKIFANLILGSIKAKHTVVGVFLHEMVLFSPIKLFFKNIFNQSKDKTFIKSLSLYEIKSSSINSESFKKEILKLSPDIVFIGSWSEKIQKETMQLPALAMINCHPSLLPKYRGPNPYTQVIIHNEPKTGITFHIVNEKFDEGNILHQKEISINSNETGFSLQKKCAQATFEEVQNLLNKLEQEIIIPIKQNEKFASYYPQLQTKDLILNFKKTSTELDCYIRAIKDWSKLFVEYKGLFFSFASHEICENQTTYKQNQTITEKTNTSISILCSDNKVIKLHKVRFVDVFCNYLYIKFLIKTGELVNQK